MESAKSDGNDMPYIHMGINGVYRGETKDGIPHGVGEFVYDVIRTKGIWEDGVLISGTRHQGDQWVFTGFLLLKSCGSALFVCFYVIAAPFIAALFIAALFIIIRT